MGLSVDWNLAAAMNWGGRNRCTLVLYLTNGSSFSEE